LYAGHTAAYQPLGIVDGTLYLLTDRDAPRKKIVSVPIARPDVANWKTIVPEGKNAIESATMAAGQIAIHTLEDVASALRLYRLDGTASAVVSLPGLGTLGPVSARFDRKEVFYTF